MGNHKPSIEWVITSHQSNGQSQAVNRMGNHKPSIEWVITNHQSNEKEYNGQMKKNKNTNNDIQNPTQKIKD